MSLNQTIEVIRKDFPVLSQTTQGKPFVYLDNAATTQKPNVVIDTLETFYRHEYATIHRGVYFLSQESTRRFEQTRKKAAAFIGANHENEIIFTRNATEAINLVATSYASVHLQSGDEIVVTEIEHHANFVPWQVLAKEKNLKFKIAPVNDQGELDLEAFKNLLTPKTKLVAFGHVSNALGTVHPIKELTTLAKRVGAVVLIDGAQATPHTAVNVQDIGCDFYCFSSHKVYGPTGVGVLYGKAEILDVMKPYQYGGEMILEVKPDHTTFAPVPARFEAGTPAIAEVIGLGAALDYIQGIGFATIEEIEGRLLKVATEKILKIPGVRLIGEAQNKASVLSFVLEGIHPHDIGSILDMEGVAIRVGHHCSQPTMLRFNVPATARASFSFYNTEEDVDAFINALLQAIKVLG